MVKAIRRFDIFLVNLDPTVGSKIQKTRPCMIVSPDEMNRHLRTVIVAPLTTSLRPYPTRVPIRFQRKQGQAALDQIRTVDKFRLVKRLGVASSETASAVAATLIEMFALGSS
ncbi:MAG TPA: type II toxin-antitoxin system PemK/MazF family toxin [Alphaproteobacteria bacterium]|nr:type II toxin-antitoxin system PemK/MazF family toxin [Alphaproteobacteria bacterium]